MLWKTPLPGQLPPDKELASKGLEAGQGARPEVVPLIESTFPQRVKHERVVDKTHRMYVVKSAHDAMGHRITQPRIYTAVDLRS